MTNVAIAHPNPLFRKALINEIEESGQYKICISASNGVELLQEIELSNTLPAICLFDIKMPLLNGYSTLLQLKMKWPVIKTVVVTELIHPLALMIMLQHGVNAYTNTSSQQILVDIMQYVESGQSYFPNDLLEGVEKLSTRNKLRNGIPLISKKEYEILALCGKNITCKEIASTMKVGERTIETHFKRLYNKLNINSRVELAQLAQYIGLNYYCPKGFLT